MAVDCQSQIMMKAKPRWIRGFVVLGGLCQSSCVASRAQGWGWETAVLVLLGIVLIIMLGAVIIVLLVA
jgi:hypothetical protein